MMMVMHGAHLYGGAAAAAVAGDDDDDKSNTNHYADAFDSCGYVNDNYL